MGRCRTRRGRARFTIESVRATAKGVVARLAGIADRNAAEALKGVELYVDRDRLPAAAEDEVLPRGPDRAGGRRSATASTIGEIVAVQNFGAGDLLEIRLAGARQTELIPFTDAFVPEVDIAARQVVVVLPGDRRRRRGVVGWVKCQR